MLKVLEELMEETNDYTQWEFSTPKDKHSNGGDDWRSIDDTVLFKHKTKKISIMKMMYTHVDLSWIKKSLFGKATLVEKKKNPQIQYRIDIYGVEFTDSWAKNEIKEDERTMVKMITENMIKVWNDSAENRREADNIAYRKKKEEARQKLEDMRLND